MIPILSPRQAAQWDAAAETAGRPLRMLMEVAGRNAAYQAMAQVSLELRRGVIVATGSGNNGGDGWVAARTLHRHGVPVWVVEAAEPTGGIAADARQVAIQDGVRVVSDSGPWPPAALVIDAMLGTGATGAPREKVASMIRRIRSLEVPIIAIDGPTGLDLETGIDRGALPANMSVTFGAFRRGHLLARDIVGDVVVVEIGHPDPDPMWPQWVDLRLVRQVCEPPDVAAHKGDRGRIVVVGGAPGMTGAARLAARSAFAAGAGLVHVVVPDQSASDIALAEPDVLVMGHPFDASLQPELVELLARADAVAIGPGLGREEGRAEFVLSVLAHCKRAVVDADALTVLADHREQLAALAAERDLLLTPHLGEFRTLFPDCAEHAPTRPWDCADLAAERSGATVLLKGVPTVVSSAGQPSLSVTTGNPGLATGGSGDVLSGFAATLLGQSAAPREAGAVAALMLGEAADRAAAELGTRNLRPMQVIAVASAIWPDVVGMNEHREIWSAIELGGFERPTTR